MRITLRLAAVVAGILATLALTPAARAGWVVRQVYVGVPVFVNINVNTTVDVPDGGSVTVGGYSSLSEGRAEYGAPVVGKAPYAGRGFRNVGYGRRTVSGKVNVRVRVIDLREEEYRQTGYRSPR